MTHFAHLHEDDFDALLSAPVTARPGELKEIPLTAFTEPCRKCGGSGQTRWGACFACNGKGKKSFRTSPAVRAQARNNAADRKADAAQSKWEVFAAAEPEVAAWVVASRATFAFAQAMFEAVARFGSLTDNQLNACKNAVAKLAARRAEKDALKSSAAAVDTLLIESAFAKAGETLKKPVLRCAGLKISHASAASANAGALYVKANGGTYLGKIMGGKFHRSRECTADDEANVLAVAADPKGAAIAYGRLTGSCSCCGRELTDPASVEAGIGPVCAVKYGW